MAWRQRITGGLARVERRYDLLKERAKRAGLRNDAVRIQPYRGYGTTRLLRLRGRVLEEAGISGAIADAGVLRNLRNMLRRYRSDEVPRARLELSLGARRVPLETDHEGFFEVELGVREPGLAASPWTDVELRLVEPFGPGQDEERAVGRVRVPGPRARLGVVSDIDDTIVRTGATSFLRHARTVLLNNAHTREPFPHVAEVYRALRAGAGGDEDNPFFYVSSSPWNLYDLLEEFLELHGLPLGPILLKDMGLERGRWLKSGHTGYKLERIARILRTYPGLRFLLVGDTGQKDAFAYRDVVRAFPDRVLAVYLRDLHPASPDPEIEAVRAELARRGVDLLLARDGLEAARHAAEHGWLAAERLRDLEADARGTAS